MQWFTNVPPGYVTPLLVALLAVVAALGLCLALVWAQLQRLEARQRQLTLWAARPAARAASRRVSGSKTTPVPERTSRHRWHT